MAFEEFWGEKLECTMDAYFQGFDECVHQMKELDPNFNVARLKKGDEAKGKEEEEEEEEEEIEKLAFTLPFFILM